MIKMNVISGYGNARGRNKFMMNVVMDQCEPFRFGVSEWKTDHTEQTSSINDVLLEYAGCEFEKANELQSRIEILVFEKVLDQCQPRMHANWNCANKEVKGKRAKGIMF